MVKIAGPIMTMDKNSRFKMIKRVETKEDGRFIIYYDFESCEPESDCAKADGKASLESRGQED